MSGPDVDKVDETFPDDIRPRGTLVIIAIFGAVFALSWLGTYFFVFLQRGTPHP